MMYETLGDRQKDYERVTDYRLIKRLPIIVRVNGRSFQRFTRKLTKPFCPDLSAILAETLMYSIMEIQGAVFGYQHHDEFSFVLRSDSSLDAEPWYQNRIQKIVSITASLVTLAFHRALERRVEKLETVGDAIFDARAFASPSISEAVNYLIWRQQDCLRAAVSTAAEIALSANLGKRNTFKLLYKKTVSEKKELLQQKLGLSFDDVFPSAFRKGVAAYKVPTLIPASEGMSSRKKWLLNTSLPSFVDDKDFIYNILLNGHDVFRAPNILT